MLFLVYSLCTIALFKIIVDIVGGEMIATYSVFLENILFLILLIMIVRTAFKQREARREKLQNKINDLNQALREIK